MFNEGYEFITNIDYSKYAIDIMKYKCRDYPPHFTCIKFNHFIQSIDELADARDLS